MTNDDAVNIISSIQAEKLGAKQTFTLIKHPNYAHIMQHDHLNAIISPEQIAINQILKSFRQGDTSQVYVLQEGAIEVTEITVHRQSTKDSVINKTINEINLPAGCQIIGIIRKEKLLITSSASRIKSEDQLVIFIDNHGTIKSIENLF